MQQETYLFKSHTSMKAGRPAGRKKSLLVRRVCKVEEPQVVAKDRQLKVMPFVVEPRSSTSFAVYGASYSGMRQCFDVASGESWSEKQSVGGSLG